MYFDILYVICYIKYNVLHKQENSIIEKSGDNYMNNNNNINLTKQEFEISFSEKNFYEKQTKDESHLDLLINMVDAKMGNKILDLGTGTGYIAFPLAKKYSNSIVIGLDIVTETMKRNKRKAYEEDIKNLSFISYDGINFPFLDNTIDTIITRYALHHFPDINHSFKEMYRIMKPNGSLIISDPTPNINDNCHFVDKFMQMKPDGHIKFYSLNEYKEMLEYIGFHFMSNKTTTIRFPRKEASSYSTIMDETDKDILSGYNIEIKGDEIWITENVLNMIYIK